MKTNNFLLEMIKKACLESRLDCDDLIDLGLELRGKKIKEQRIAINRLCRELKIPI